MYMVVIVEGKEFKVLCSPKPEVTMNDLLLLFLV